MMRSKRAVGICTTIIAVVTCSDAARAQASAQSLKIDTGDTAWMITATAMVLLMTLPGLALFYGGMVRRKNVLGTLMHSFILAGLVTVQWMLIGYSLAFGPDWHGIIGSLAWAGLSGVGAAPNPDYAATIPHQAYMLYQCMFAIITPALITGAFAERITFRGFVIFSLLWMTFIYDPLAHWVWGAGGWIHRLGALDFAGGTVVHISSGISALAAALIIGKRLGFPQDPMPPHNLTLTLAGAALLWVGWFGFNGGSAFGANGLAVSALVATHLSAAAASLSWSAAEWAERGKPTVLGAASGAVAGLVAITPAAGYVAPISALFIGAFAGWICFIAVRVKYRFGYDDALDVVGVHGVGGAFGALVTGIFASKLINPAGADGLLRGNPSQMLIQLIAVLVAIAFAFIGSVALLKLVDLLVGLRVHTDEERMGLDLAEHEEAGYTF